MMKWKITIEAWPYSTGEGADKDQKACGDRSHVFTTIAEDIKTALRHADLICQGIQQNPRVWQTVIMSIHGSET